VSLGGNNPEATISDLLLLFWVGWESNPELTDSIRITPLLPALCVHSSLLFSRSFSSGMYRVAALMPPMKSETAQQGRVAMLGALSPCSNMGLGEIFERPL
jgi:hypothetical protein